MSKALIGIPTRGFLFHSVIQFLHHQAKKGYDIYKHTSAISVEIARMGILNYFLKGDYTHLFFMDDDVICQEDSIDTLLSHGVDVISLNYPIYRDGRITSCAYGKQDGNYFPLNFDETNFQLVDAVGLGGCLISREVLEFFRESQPFKIYYENGEIVKGEDIGFCEKLREAKINIYCDLDLKADHINVVSLGELWSNFVIGGKV